LADKLMLTYVDPATISPSQFEQLTAAAATGGWTELDVAYAVLGRGWTVFSFDGGIMAVSASDGVLTVEAWAANSFYKFMRRWQATMQRLAADMQCNTIQTTVVDARLARAMVRIGGEVESWNMRWQVDRGQSDGQ
jgi:hypothetical protein